MTKKELEQLYYLKGEIAMWQSELDRIREQSLIQSPSWKGMGGHSGISDKVADAAIREADLIKIIEGKQTEITLQRARILTYIANLDDVLMRQIVYWRNIVCANWVKVAMEIGGNNSQDGLRMYYNRYFKNQ